MMRSSQKHWGYWAALLHRLSGLALVCFLPLHFLALGLALEGEGELQSFLSWSEQFLVKSTEIGLVVALTLHLGLGLRVLAIEALPWRGTRAFLAVLSFIFAAVMGGAVLAAIGGAV